MCHIGAFDLYSTLLTLSLLSSFLLQPYQLEVLDFNSDSRQPEITFTQTGPSERLYVLVVDAHSAIEHIFYEEVDTVSHDLETHHQDDFCAQDHSGGQGWLGHRYTIHSQGTQGPDDAHYILWDLNWARPKDQESWRVYVFACRDTTHHMRDPTIITVHSEAS